MISNVKSQNEAIDVYKDIINNVNDGIYFLNCDRVITYWNKAAENMTGFTSDEILGSRCRDNILTHIDERGCKLCTTNQCPAYKSIKTGKTVDVDNVYMHHKNGQRICITVRTSPVYDDNGYITGAVEIFRRKQSKEQLLIEIESLRNLALLDPLTNVGNRRFAEISLSESFNQLGRYNWNFGLLFFDIDHFKKFNDIYGHETGDKVLKMIAQTCCETTRSFDKIARWGGEEFIALIMNTTKENLYKTAQKLRMLVEHCYLNIDGENISATISIGATMARSDETAMEMIKRADKLMYESKTNGRNRVTIG